MFFGHTCENSLTPALVRPTMAAVPPSLRMKAFLPFPLDTTSAVRLLPGFSAVRPADGPRAESHPPSHPWTPTCHKEEARFLRCLPNAVQLTDSSGSAPFILSLLPKEVQPSASSMTSSTPAPLASPLTTSAPRSEPSTGEVEEERPPELPSEPDQEPEAKVATDAETEEEKARRLLYCSLCKVAVNSASQLEAHNSGTKHKTHAWGQDRGGLHQVLPQDGGQK
ncbi:zinc finger protein 385D isoform X3 [Takifugu rubripes]|uniref:zinc finger protein 385D isoform X3 n=1 Tax=Takifugu rubripes TaxID=31033 RepID=UPI0011456133|nr:zinc finger protein 385D-like isoform X3 [Takifugu rubripes]